MPNSLDLLVIVSVALAAVSLLSLCLLFLIRNPRIKALFFYIVAALGICTGYIGFRIGAFLFPAQTAVGVAVAVVSTAAIALFATGRNSERRTKIAQFAASGSLLIGFANAFLF